MVVSRNGLCLSIVLLAGCPQPPPARVSEPGQEAVGGDRSELTQPGALEPTPPEARHEPSASPHDAPVDTPIDTDGDEIADVVDTCPNEPGALQFGGCATASSVQLTPTRLLFEGAIRFEVEHATLRPHSFALLDRIVAVVRSHPGIYVRVEGHSDDRESNVAAVPLSTWRARAVRDYLVQHGVASRQTGVRGFGDSRPLVPNDNDAHRAQNRRIEFHVEYR